jgi:integrase
MKSKKQHRVALSAPALDIVKGQLGHHERWVFPGLKQTKHISNMAMLSLLKEMNQDATVHGFRSTFKNWAAERTNFSRQVVEFAMAHVNQDTTESAYLHSDLLEKRFPLMAEWAKYCNTKPLKATVTDLSSKAI